MGGRVAIRREGLCLRSTRVRSTDAHTQNRLLALAGQKGTQVLHKWETDTGAGWPKAWWAKRLAFPCAS
eukprot:CAMPEP_0171504752 /NCGR_PEP_ID=MMETSP0958-20121227/11774_1 /TAXON_ID=87120 /ORGANISM="Aurantiochytrium limacinum, Strain ATCCMYA-1381" /LENGTH=68 /DNA_ID=CAMNT_0012040685 /DNA_START=481 /DNA_END=687 /DNA_ORIENTATION=+